LNQADSSRYEDEEALRQQVEKRSKRSLSDDEWTQVAPKWSEPYGDQDVVEILQAVRDSPPPQPKPSLEEKARGYRQAHVRRGALKAREIVEDLRSQLFGGQMPPFPEDAAAAIRWIEEQVNPIQTMRLSLEVTVPAAEAGITPLIYLRDLLDRHLPENPPIPEDPQAFRQLLDRCGFINDISFSQPTPLAYVDWVNPQDEMGVKRISAPDGTLLGQLREASETLAAAVNWEPYAAVYHLLTGGIMSPKVIQEFVDAAHCV